MGNGPASTKDGSTFLGKGFIHLTGKGQYQTITSLWNSDSENANNKMEFDGRDIDLLTTNLDVAMKASMYFWQKKKLNDLADNRIENIDIDKVGGKVNGVIYPSLPYGYDSRRSITKVAFNILK
ncbi:hypothetical protein [Flectobacillus longus]|uniref:Glycoside hydrolase family 19 catalytic domain-containing protein n=1 Tax=Flectobacillus longus TaxID=2984207 RepID=A0ABT6YT73_9BACT|nr:hypothetical protein [Flectobacillus longus]MDI9866761.1 hypothetical protein [Flectobacillus longus]MDI9881036.1 hypothetical protein [Flectobacillus longus]